MSKKEQVTRVFSEKKKGFDIQAQNLYSDLKNNLRIENLESVRILNRYDISGVSDSQLEQIYNIIFCEPPVDLLHTFMGQNHEIVIVDDVTSDRRQHTFAIEYLPGQYDQRADSALQCMQIITLDNSARIKTAKVIVLTGDISERQLERIKNYCINPVECREASMDKPDSLEWTSTLPPDIETLSGDAIDRMDLAMDANDLAFCKKYFAEQEKREPTMTEIKVIDTYWSDHCRHTTFLTNIEQVEIEDGYCSDVIKSAYAEYLDFHNTRYSGLNRPICLMSLATAAMKEIPMEDLDQSDEINACSIKAQVDVDGKTEQWLIMFKNETHNHPTEIEPFGGAATCLGGAIRDPLSGRTYVYQAMRVTGSGDPRQPVEKTIAGKLPQIKITKGAASGYSSYGNQIGLSTGLVSEVYHPGFVAKRMEIGAVVGAARAQDVVRKKPAVGDIVILLGGKTGRDGCGGATGSSRAHTEQSLENCGAEVQKGNPLEERKIQRLFRNPNATLLIKKCNDFGAGGVCVAIGELADSIEIDLDKVSKKYDGLDGTELAISESQERMAVLVDAKDADTFINYAHGENLEATKVAVVTDDGYLRMYWRKKVIVNISREFLNTNGATRWTNVKIAAPDKHSSYFAMDSSRHDGSSADDGYDLDKFNARWRQTLEDLNICSQKGLVEQFDSTVGASTVLMPFGGKYQLTPSQCMAAKIPVLAADMPDQPANQPDSQAQPFTVGTCPVKSAETNTATIMSYGYNPFISEWSPFHGAVYSIVDATAKICAAGGNYEKIRLTLQEYFERLENDCLRWGKPFAALLGAYYAQKRLGIPAIGGKDSMSGSFNELSVPPTLVAFAINVADAREIISPEFKRCDSHIVLIPVSIDQNHLPSFDDIHKNYSFIYSLIAQRKVLSAYAVGMGGLAEAISKMCFGNKMGATLSIDSSIDWFYPYYGSIVLEISKNFTLESIFGGNKDIAYKVLGRTKSSHYIYGKKTDKIESRLRLDVHELINHWSEPLEKIFPTMANVTGNKSKDVTIGQYDFKRNRRKRKTKNILLSKLASPRVFIPVFPGTNCEYDSARAFDKAGAHVEIMVFNNLTPSYIEQSLEEMIRIIKQSQIIMLPGGFSGGDEPDGSGKFIAAVFRNSSLKAEVTSFLKQRDGLMLGICNGFQALIKLGLLPYGEIRNIDSKDPTLTFNSLGRHISCMANTKIISNLSPWFNNVKVGDVHTISFSHGEGRFISGDIIERLAANGQVATQYVNFDKQASMITPFNPNGSMYAVEGITSLDGRILGKMGHSERIGRDICKNVHGAKDQKIFEAGVKYFS